MKISENHLLLETPSFNNKLILLIIILCTISFFDLKKFCLINKKYFNNDKLKILLNTQLKNILNGDIRKNYRKFKQEHNSELIKEYEKSSNEEIISFFNCELIDCIKYFRKDDDIIYNDHFSFLKGLEEYYDEFENLNEMSKFAKILLKK